MKDIDRLVFWAGLSVLAVLILFGLGFAVATYRIAPYQSMKDAKDLVDSLVEHGEFIPENLRWPAPRGASREEFVAHQPQLQSDGTYVFLIYDHTQGHYVARRYSALGEHLHTWDLNYSDLNPDSSVDPATVDPHGFAVLNDGSVVVDRPTGTCGGDRILHFG